MDILTYPVFFRARNRIGSLEKCSETQGQKMCQEILVLVKGYYHSEEFYVIRRCVPAKIVMGKMQIIIQQYA